MKTLTEQLTKYATYHRDRRNIATHLVGVPMIAFAVMVLLARPTLAGASPWVLIPAVIVALPVLLYYLRMSLAIGALMGVLFAIGLVGAHAMAQWGTSAWLTWGIGLFVIGWIIQSIGHVFEGRKPAFIDDVIGLLIGPLFVVCEVLFALGLALSLKQAVEDGAGPTRSGPSNQVA